MELQQAKEREIQRKAHVPESDRTDGKDQAAAWIQKEIVERGRWPLNISQIAEESGWSRQHITHTIEDYFEVAGAATEIEYDGGRARIEFELPSDADRESYVRGYLRGWLDARDE